MKFIQLIEDNERNTFLQNLWEKKKKKKKKMTQNGSGPLRNFFKKFIWGKNKWLAPYFRYILVAID